MKMSWFTAVFFSILITVGGTATSVFAGGDNVEGDFDSILRLRRGLSETVRYVVDTPEVFELLNGDEMPERQVRDELRATWQRYAEYNLAMDALLVQYSDFREFKGAAKNDAFQVLHAAYVAQYRYALEFLTEMDKCEVADKVLNEAMPKMGLPKGSFADYKFRFLNVKAATGFAAFGVLEKVQAEGSSESVRAAIEEDRRVIWKMGEGKGLKMTAGNAWKVVADWGKSSWMPVQKSVSKAMGRTKVYRKGEYLISQEQLKDLSGKLQPGDILLERREWYMSNIGLPGFWTHAALYVGTPEERAAYFATSEVAPWVKGKGEDSGELERLLRGDFPKAYGKGAAVDAHGYSPKILEAIEAGVVFSSLEKSGHADSLAVMRPRISKVEKARAIYRAFGYHGRPYDFDFDFLTDAELVCSELIYKCFEPLGDYKGLKLPLSKLAGRLITPPNLLVEQFDSQYANNIHESEFVAFLDGYESEGRAVDQPLEEFRASWKRPKWHIFVQGEAPEENR
jgi:hypothetical protein